MSKKSSKISHWLPDRTPFPRAEIALCLNIDEVTEVIKEKGIDVDPWWPQGHGELNSIKQGGKTRYYIVCLQPTLMSELKPAEFVALAAHEALHYVQGVCEEIGEKKPGVEFEAYLMQQVTLDIIAKYEDKKGYKLPQAA